MAVLVPNISTPRESRDHNQRDLLVRDFADNRHGYSDHESQARRVQVGRSPREIADTDCIGR